MPPNVSPDKRLAASSGGAHAVARGGGDPAEHVARVATAHRDLLLGVHRRRLRWEDLEDAYGQATLELVARARRQPFHSAEHIRNALEQKFVSRIEDRRRALGGRSPIESALASAVQIDADVGGESELEDRSMEVTRQVATRFEVRRIREVAAELTEDQRLVLAAQISLAIDSAEFCKRFGWSSDKYRKTAQRARKRLAGLVVEYEAGERCQRLGPDLLALSAGVAAPAQQKLARAHLENCRACAHQQREIERAARAVAAILPVPLPIAAKAGLAAKLATSLEAARRLFGAGGHTGATGAAGGSSLASAGVVKLGVAVVCITSAAGGYAIVGRSHHPHRIARPDRSMARSLPSRGPRVVDSTAPGHPLRSRPGASIRRAPRRTAPVTHRAASVTSAHPLAVAARDVSPQSVPSSRPPSGGGQAAREFGFER